MSLPIIEVPHVLTLDDVQPAELVTGVASAHNSAVDHFRAEHPASGLEIGRHDLPVVPSAVARWNMPASPTTDNLVNGAGSIAFSIGFDQAPRLVVGNAPTFFTEDGFYLVWKLARPVGRPLLMVTPGWSGSGTRPKYQWDGDSQGNGVLYIAFADNVNNPPRVPETLKSLTHVTLAICELRA